LHDAAQRAGIPLSSIDLLISASAIAVQALPCTATHLLRAAGLPDGTPGFDVNLSCASFVVGLQVAAGLLQTTAYKRIAIVSSELPSRGLNWKDEESSLIFGDGAACAIVEQGNSESGIAAYRMESYFTQGDWCEVRAGGTRCNPASGMQAEDFYFSMHGKKVFKMAAKYLRNFQDALLSTAKCGLDAIDWVIPHQASHLGLSHAMRILALPADKVVSIYGQYGNQVAASIPTALHELSAGGHLRSGHRVMLMATAASLSLAGMVLVI
jgi:3-oxoacyl-[acyl-carrier-protein] synthase-3